MNNAKYINYQTGEVLDWFKVEQLHDNALLKVKPKLWEQWDFKKNNELGFDIWKLTFGSNEKVWWICEKGHKWDAVINNRDEEKGCPYCANKKVMIGFNDMWTTNPELASMLLNYKDGHEYMQFSNKKLEWKCPNCRKIIERKVRHVNEKGLHCSRCGVTSRSNKPQIKLLREKNVNVRINKM